MKKAMILADKEGFRIQLQVHDELDFSCRNDNEAKELAEVMLGAVELRVPSKVDLESGPSWGEIKEKGTHSELIANGGEYAKIAKLQRMKEGALANNV